MGQSSFVQSGVACCRMQCSFPVVALNEPPLSIAPVQNPDRRHSCLPHNPAPEFLCRPEILYNGPAAFSPHTPP